MHHPPPSQSPTYRFTMQHSYLLAISSAMFLFLTGLLLSTATKAHNVTEILAEFPHFSTFNNYLTSTLLFDEINHGERITVCAVDNLGMADLVSKNYSDFTKKNVISLHVLLDYFGVRKLHKISYGTVLAATMYKDSGDAPGLVNITDLSGGKVGFGAVDNGGVLDATFIKSIKEIPYNISIIQISKAIFSPKATAPEPPQTQLNMLDLMSPHGCKKFALSLLKSSLALITFEDSVTNGVTVFCPNDDSMINFLPIFNNLTERAQESILEYHGVPNYMSLPALKTNNGPVNTLATDEHNKFNFEIQNDGKAVTLKTKIMTAKILSTLKDKKPVSIFVLDKVLIPSELFSSDPTPTPAPDSANHKSPPTTSGIANSPAEGQAEGQAVDDMTNSGRGIGLEWGKIVVVTFSIGILTLLLV